MTVFKTILRLIKRNLGYGILTLATLLILIPFVSSESKKVEGYKYNVCYNGNIENATEKEKQLIKYLEKYKIEHQEYTDEEIKVVDALNIYNMIINLNEKNEDKKITIKDEILSLEINQFSAYLDYYGDYEKAKNIMDESVETKQLDVKPSNTKTTVNSFLMYQISLFVLLIAGQILSVLYKENIEKKRMVSNIRPSRYMLEIILGMAVIITIAVVVSLLVSAIFVNYTIKDIIYHFVNFTLFAVSMLALSSLICRITTNRQIAMGFANTITLALAFTSGGFIPLELVKPGFIKFAKLFPEYYAIKNVYNGAFNTEYLKNLGIILLFGIAYYVVSVLLSRVNEERLK